MGSIVVLLFIKCTLLREKMLIFQICIQIEKALELNKLLGGKDNFTASNDWFVNWKKKYGLPDLTFIEENKPLHDSAVNQLTMVI